MSTIKTRHRIMATLGAAICTLTTVVPAATTSAAEPRMTPIGTITVNGKHVKMTRTIYETDPADIQKAIDKCLGGVVHDAGVPGATYYAGHRTSCIKKGGVGFENLDKLQNGDTVVVKIDKQPPKTYRMFDEGLGDYHKDVPIPPIGTQLALEASYSQGMGDTRVHIKYLAPDGIERALGNRGRKITQGHPACVAIPNAKKGDWAFVNVTPAAGEKRGNGTAYPAGKNKIVPNPWIQPSTSTVNWNTTAPAPNTTLVQVGDDAKVCVATFVKPAHIIIDALAVASADRFDAAHRRLLDTRSANRPVNKSTACFSVPNAANKFAVFNLTAIGLAAGWGRLQPRSTNSLVSNVNFGNGDVDPNMVIIKVPSDGTLCYYGSAKSHAVVDLIAIAKNGTFEDVPTLPKRVVDSRNPVPKSVVQFTSWHFTGVNNGWVFVNETPIPHGNGSARIYDCLLYPATGSDVNYKSRVDPNVGVIKTGSEGTVCMASTGANPGWVLDFVATAKPNVFKTPSKRRIYDSRLP